MMVLHISCVQQKTNSAIYKAKFGHRSNIDDADMLWMLSQMNFSPFLVSSVGTVD